ncbi:MAG: sugar ABC transporter permease [Chloroflexi bacterium]|nr:sugar ABC transporter permease [Chloroflexota bacterium]
MFWAVVVLSPSIVAVLIFIYAFILWTGFISLVNWNDVTPTYGWVGLQNFVRLFQTPRFITDLRNTVVFSVVFMGQCLIVGLMLAILLDQKVRGEAFFRTVYVLPFAISAIVTGISWKWLMNPGSGIDAIFDVLGLKFLENKWFADPNIGIAATAIAAAWQMSGYTMALYLAGLRGISGELRDAAKIDGASGVQYYRHVAIPLVMPVTLTAVIILGTISLRLFDLPASMTSSGPGFATDSPAFFMFQTTFQQYKYSQGAAIGVVMLLIALLVIVPYFFTIRDEVEA